MDLESELESVPASLGYLSMMMRDWLIANYCGKKMREKIIKPIDEKSTLWDFDLPGGHLDVSLEDVLPTLNAHKEARVATASLE